MIRTHAAVAVQLVANMCDILIPCSILSYSVSKYFVSFFVFFAR